MNEETVSEQRELNEEVQLGNRVKGEIELPKLDLSQYIGKESVIVSVKEYKGIHGYYFEASTSEIDVLKLKDGQEKPLIVSMRYGIHEVDGVLGYGTGTKTLAMLESFGVKHHNELVGKKVLIQKTPNAKTGKEYLTFTKK